MGTYQCHLQFCECRWGGSSNCMWWGYINTTCKQTCLNFFHSLVVGAQKPSSDCLCIPCTFSPAFTPFSSFAPSYYTFHPFYFLTKGWCGEKGAEAGEKGAMVLVKVQRIRRVWNLVGRCKKCEGWCKSEKGAKVGEKIQRVRKVQRLVKRVQKLVKTVQRLVRRCKGWEGEKGVKADEKGAKAV